MYWQIPADAQRAPTPQWDEHDPQCSGVSSLTHALSHAASPAPQGTHAPSRHTSAPPHARPHPPQFA